MKKNLSLNDLFYIFTIVVVITKWPPPIRNFLNKENTKNKYFQVGFFSPHFSAFGNYLEKQF
jgi:hypothetical protein